MRFGAGVLIIGLGLLVFVSSSPSTYAQNRRSPTLAQVQAVFDRTCVRCHSGHTPPRGLNLSPGHAGQIIGSPSTGLPTMMLVEPGDPDRSYLFLKITDQHLQAGGSGRRCPIGQPPLPQNELDLIRRWIESGAR